MSAKNIKTINFQLKSFLRSYSLSNDMFLQVKQNSTKWKKFTLTHSKQQSKTYSIDVNLFNEEWHFKVGDANKNLVELIFEYSEPGIEEVKKWMFANIFTKFSKAMPAVKKAEDGDSSDEDSSSDNSSDLDSSEPTAFQQKHRFDSEYYEWLLKRNISVNLLGGGYVSAANPSFVTESDCDDSDYDADEEYDLHFRKQFFLEEKNIVFNE